MTYKSSTMCINEKNNNFELLVSHVFLKVTLIAIRALRQA